MDREIFNWETAGALIIFILGTLFHFFYDWFGRFGPLGLFFPVNESVWEHLKLVLWPVLIYAVFEHNRIRGISNNFWAAKTIGIYAAIVSIIVIFYTYTSILGYNILFIDILTFFISVVIGQYVSLNLLKHSPLPDYTNKVSVLLLSLLIFVFFMFTYNPPRLPLFQNPVDGTYGI